MTIFPDFGYGKLHFERALNHPKFLLFICKNKVSNNRFLFIQEDPNRQILFQLSNSQLASFIRGELLLSSIALKNKPILVCFSRENLTSITTLNHAAYLKDLFSKLDRYEESCTQLEYLKKLEETK